MAADAGNTECLGDDALARILQRELTAEESELCHAHLARCARCRRLVAEGFRLFLDDESEEEPHVEEEERFEAAAALPVGVAGAKPVQQTMAPGTQVSRYVLRALIGAGEAGAVYQAHDPHLGRLVALKLVLRDRGRRMADGPALAKLSHPNVVNVYDAGIYEGQPFVVMELVEGSTLGQWLGQRRRSWREVVSVFQDAARGLAAAHAVGLVHRDFKPDNVIVGTDGRARVADFGLAASKDAEAAAGVAGTPAYMPPEQFQGRAADARGDQFSFCVAFYRALYGQHPFGLEARGVGDPLLGLARDVIAGRVRPPPKGAATPAWLAQVILRGLSASPEERYPTMEALLAALDQGLAGPTAAAEAAAVGPAAAVGAAAAGEARAWRPNLVTLGVAVAVAGTLALALFAQSRGKRGSGVNAADRRCGNGALEPGEECDDGNGADGDGCSARCLRCTAGEARFVWSGTGHCYSRHDRSVSWEEAAAACRGMGAHLATWSGWPELRDASARLLAGRSGDYWIGLRAARDSRDYGWVTAEPASPMLSWASERSLPGGCVSQDAGASLLGALKPWSARPCATALGYLCEKPAWKVAPGTNHAYRQLGPVLVWKDAVDACARAGAHLLTIADADESAFVSSQFFGGLWLGAAIVRPGESRFRWVTGEPVDFQLFAPGEPDRREVPNCLVLGADRKWYDRPCDGSQAGPYDAVCEID